MIFYILENSSPAFEEFLDFLGQRVKLRGFENYKGGLDVRGDTTGEYRFVYFGIFDFERLQDLLFVVFERSIWRNSLLKTYFVAVSTQNITAMK